MTERNIVVVVSDDHGQWCASPYGNQEVRTPTLQYLADAGVRMDNAFCPTPVCSPARASLFTGRRPSQHGIHDWLDIDADDGQMDWLGAERTLPELLGDAGYRTGIAGKWHCGRGRIHDAFDDVHSMHDGGFSGKKFSLRRDRWITDGALDFIADAADQPFFLTVGYSATHSSWRDEPARLVSPYRDATFADVPDDPTYRYGRGDVLAQSEPRRSLANYYAAVEGIDEQVGRLLDGLDDADVLEDTVFVYTADHGLNCGHHGIWGKGNGTVPQNMLDESIRVPLIVGPHGGVAGGQRRDEFVDHCDLFRTLLDAADVLPPTDRTYPGSSYWGPLATPDGVPTWTQRQICEYGDVRMVRTQRYKLVRRYFDAPDLLFDLERDPRETTNVIDRDEYAAVEDQLGALLEDAFDDIDGSDLDGRAVEQLPDYNGGNEPWRQR